MDIHPWTKYEIATLRDEERLLRATAAMRARELRTADAGENARPPRSFGWLRRRRAGGGLSLGQGSDGMSTTVRAGSIRAAVVVLVAVLVWSAAPQRADGSRPGTALPATGGQQAPVLEESRRIAREVEQSHRGNGARLLVAEVAAMFVVETVELMPGLARPGRSVPAANGIYFAICKRSPCALQRHDLSRERALMARRAAVELALRTLEETTADLVVVALPRRWRATILLVLTRDDVQARGDAGLDDTARRHLYIHGGLVPYSSTRDSLLAFPLEPGSEG
jgi:hypothetical protein